MINIAICDDNKAMLDYLSREIGECFQEALVNTKIRATPHKVHKLEIKHD